MAVRDTVDPVEVPSSFGDAQRFTHPAFGQITVSRLSGATYLYGSDFKHSHFIRVEIHPSVLDRHLAHDWYFQHGAPIISVDMSEAQWGEFVSSFGLGAGVPCTIVRRDNAPVPGIPHRDEAQTHKAEAKAAVAAALQEIQNVIDLIDITPGLTNKTRASLRGQAQQARRALDDHLPFVEESFLRRMEERVAKAKVEVEGWIGAQVRRLGIDAIMGKSAPVALPAPKEDDE